MSIASINFFQAALNTDSSKEDKFMVELKPYLVEKNVKFKDDNGRLNLELPYGFNFHVSTSYGFHGPSVSVTVRSVLMKDGIEFLETGTVNYSQHKSVYEQYLKFFQAINHNLLKVIDDKLVICLGETHPEATVELLKAHVYSIEV